MPGWIDNFPDSPIVMFQLDDGSSVPVARAQAQQFGYTPTSTVPQVPGAATPMPSKAVEQAPLPEIEMPAESRPQADAPPNIEMPAENVPPRPFSARFRQNASGPEAIPPPAPPTPTGATVPGIGYVPPNVPGVTQPVMPGDVNKAQAQQQFAAQQQANDPFSMTTGDAIVGKTAIAQNAADATAAAYERQRAEQANLEARRAAEAAQDQKTLDTYRLGLQKSIDQYANDKVDPSRKWHSMSTGSKVLAAISIALSGIGSAMKGQGDKNPALDILRAAIAQDINLQMAEHDRLGQAIAMQRGQMDDFSRMSSSKQQEFAARNAAALARTARDVQAIAARSNSDMVKYNAKDLIDGLNAQGQAAFDQANQLKLDNTLKLREDARKEQAAQDAHAKAMGAMGGGGAGGGLAGKTGTAGSYASLDQIDPKYRASSVRMPDGSWVITKDKEAAKAADQQLADSRVMVNNIDRVLTKLNDPGLTTKLESKVLGDVDEASAITKQELTQLMANGKNFLQLGAISDSDMKLINNLGADPSQVTNVIQQIRPKLENWRSGIVDDAFTRVQQYGVDIDKSSYGEAPQRAAAKASGADKLTGEGKKGDVLDIGDMAPRDKATGEPIPEAVLTPDAQRANVAAFVEQARHEGRTAQYGTFSESITSRTGEAAVQAALRKSKGGLDATDAELKRLGGDMAKWSQELASAKTAKARAAAVDKLSKAKVQYESLTARRSAIYDAIRESAGRSAGTSAHDAEMRSIF